MRQYKLQLLLLLLDLQLLLSDITSSQRHRISDLPRLRFQPQFQQYSGYLNGLNDKKLFYWLVEASDTQPQEAPLLLWLNGGPGCSSIGGMLMSNGPFLANRYGHLVRNKFAWNRAANVLYIDSPAGVGLSDTLHNLSKSVLNDKYTIEAKLTALKHFFSLFPEYHGRRFYIAGESYAGVYIPMLAAGILKSSQYPSVINLRSVAIGNGLIVSHRDPILREEQRNFSQVMGIKMNHSMTNKYNCAQPCYLHKHTDGSNYPCLNSTGLTDYLNDAQVRRVLGVAPHIPAYSICNLTSIFRNYAYKNESMLKEILQLVSANISIMVYHGHLDQLIPFGVPVRLLESDPVALPEDEQLLDSWYYCRKWPGQPARQLGGMQRTFAGARLILRSVIGAGHSVATDLPEAAYQILTDLLREVRLPHELIGQKDSCPPDDDDRSSAAAAVKLQLQLLLVQPLLWLLAARM